MRWRKQTPNSDWQVLLLYTLNQDMVHDNIPEKRHSVDLHYYRLLFSSSPAHDWPSIRALNKGWYRNLRLNTRNQSAANLDMSAMNYKRLLRRLYQVILRAHSIVVWSVFSSCVLCQSSVLSVQGANKRTARAPFFSSFLPRKYTPPRLLFTWRKGSLFRATVVSLSLLPFALLFSQRANLSPEKRLISLCFFWKCSYKVVERWLDQQEMCRSLQYRLFLEGRVAI